MYKKILSKEESEIYSLLELLSLQNITVPYMLKENILYMQKGDIVTYNEIDLQELYSDVLSSMYQYLNSSFSKGIYCFFSSNNTKVVSNYYEHLVFEIDNIVYELSPCLDDDFKETFNRLLEIIKNNLNRHKNYFISKKKFELLHGDLFSGNVLQYAHRKLLIDFEYIRFGPMISELSFFLCWDIISDPNSDWDISLLFSNLEKLLNSNIISVEESDIIKMFYIPLYTALAILFASAKKYADDSIIKLGALNFVSKYFGKVEGLAI